MKVIHKQKFNIDEIKGCITLTVPHNSRILKVGNQQESLAVWYLCDPDSRGVTIYTLYVFGTGQEVFENAHTYIDTVSFFNGTLILHVFDGVHVSPIKNTEDKKEIHNTPSPN